MTPWERLDEAMPAFLLFRERTQPTSERRAGPLLCETYGEAAWAWMRLKAELARPPLADGGHFGYCTKVAVACFRCHVEELVREAKAALEAVWGEALDVGCPL